MNCIKELNELLDQGKVRCQTHPTLDLVIWNYTEQVQFSREWTPLLLKCRGLVTNTKGDFIAKSFDKFFNYEEIANSPEVMNMICNQPYIIQEKLDGSMGMMFWYQGQWIFATRGSFESDQAKWAEKWMWENFKESDFDTTFTYIFEIIYKDNRIVVLYEEEMCKFITAFLGYDEMNGPLFRNTLMENVPLKYYLDTRKGKANFIESEYMNLKSHNFKNKEGYVLRFKDDYRVKIKFEDYIRLHKVMTNLSTLSIWEILKDGGKVEDILKDVPDEIYDKIKDFERGLENKTKMINMTSWLDYMEVILKTGEDDRKEFAFQASKKKYPVILFRMLDKKDYKDIIWKTIKPKHRIL